MRKIAYPPTLYDVVPCQGGWDLETPTLTLPTGYVRDAINFEVSPVKGGGYRRVDGYERFDGRTSPSSATFTLIQVDLMLVQPVVGGTLTGVTSGATAKILAVGVNYLIVNRVVGSFVNAEVVTWSATPVGTTVTQTVFLSALQTAQYIQLSADDLRLDITTVPGSGPVRGVAVLPINDVDHVYAWRDNVGATACVIHHATVSGWSAVTLFSEVSFTTGGPAQPSEGDTLTQGGATGTIKRVVHESGSWIAGNAAGRIIYAPIGGTYAAGAATAPGGITVTLSGAGSAITLTPGGRYEFDTYNFFGQASTRRLYGCSGVQRGFEFDGTVYVPISVDPPNVDTVFPEHVACHKDHLFFSVGGSILHSGPGEPYKFPAAAGGGEIATGDEVTNFLKQPGGTDTGSIGVSTRSNVHILYGTSGLNWNFVSLNQGVMGLPYSGGRLNQSYWFDNNGVTSLRASREWGNFDSAMLTNTITQFIVEKRGFLVGSAVQRDKSQYRVFFSDGSALYCTIVNGRLFGLMPQQFPNPFYTLWDGPSTDGDLYAGAAASGYVYKLDTGTSFDGQNIDARLVFNWNPTKSPRVLKRYRSASIEMQGGSYAAISLGYNLSYGRQGIPQGTFRQYTAQGSGVSFWDAFTWDEFYWDGQIVSPVETELRGTGENIQLAINSGTNYIPSYTLNSLIFHYTPRRGMR